MWVPPETEARPHILKSNSHLFLDAFSLFESILSYLYDKNFTEEKTIGKKIPKCLADLKINNTITNNF